MKTQWNYTLVLVPVMIVGYFGLKYYKSFRGMGGGNQQKTKIKKFNKEENIKIRFENVAGLKEAKVEIVEFVDFLKNPKEYEK